MTPVRRRRGRPRKPDALSPTERTRRYRARRRGGYPSLDALRETRRLVREQTARGAALEALRSLRSRGVHAGVFGSLATGRFGLHSDVDFIVLECPQALRYRIETDIEEHMRGIPFDVAYADELREPWRSRALATLRDESALR